MRHSHRLIAALASLYVSFVVSAAEGEFEASNRYAPKLSLRTTNGLLLNAGSTGGSTLSLGGINAVFSYFFTQKIATGLAYDITFDYGSASIPLSGPDIFVRYYFLGNGTAARTYHARSMTESLDRIGVYGGASLSQRTYFLGSNTSESTLDELTGHFFTLNVLAGADYRLNRNFEINAEGLFSLLTFAASDNRVQVRSLALLVGISYIF